MIKRTFIKFLFLLIGIIFCNGVVFANAAPPSRINTVQLVWGIDSQLFSYYFPHWHLIGVCFWYEFPTVYTTAEIDEYLPDMVVTVSNDNGDNPWQEANIADKGFYSVGNQLIKAKTGASLSDGNANTDSHGEHYDSIRTKSVDVIGAPVNLFHLPLINLRLDTHAFYPYYSSDTDVMGRLGLAEAVRPETWKLDSNLVGSGFTNHWGYEFPRSMTSNVENDYKASVMAALHAADIVTNKNVMHTVHSTSDSCGEHKCAVSNVIEEMNDDHEIWQEVYPNNRHIQLGESDSTTTDSLGSQDEKNGNGNYVFVVWRHYRGCVQSGGHFLWQTAPVSLTVKR